MRLLWIPTSLALLLIAGCAGRGSYTVRYQSRAVAYSDVPPPEPLAEVIPPSPGPGYAWVDGYWTWDDGQYVWVNGYWDRRPDSGYVWLHHGWVYDDGQYRLMPGRWVRRGYEPNYVYVHPRPRVRYGDRYHVIRRPNVIVRGDRYVVPRARAPRYVEPRRPGHVYVQPARPRVLVRPAQPRTHVRPRVEARPRRQVYVRPPQSRSSVRVEQRRPEVEIRGRGQPLRVEARGGRVRVGTPRRDRD